MGEIADGQFGHYDHLWGSGDEDLDDEDRHQVRCNRCGSADVRWRQQGGRWVLFNLGVGEHVCPIDDSGFKAIDS